MVGVARNINEFKRQHERALRAAEMQRLLDGSSNGADLTSLGDLLLEVKLVGSVD